MAGRSGVLGVGALRRRLVWEKKIADLGAICGEFDGVGWIDVAALRIQRPLFSSEAAAVPAGRFWWGRI